MSYGAGQGGQGSGTEAPAVRVVREMVGDAVRMRASDIHIEPRKSSLEVRMRVDGVIPVLNRLLYTTYASDVLPLCSFRTSPFSFNTI